MFSNPKDSDMYHHAKMAHIATLKKRLMGMMGHHPTDDEMNPSEPGQEKGLSDPTHQDVVHQPDDLAMSPHHGDGMPDSPEEEQGESPAEEDDEMTAMKKAYFKPKSRERRPGTGVMIALAPKSGASGPKMGGMKGKK